MKKPVFIVAALIVGLVAGALLMAALRIGSLFGSGANPETIATASLQSVREQARLTAFAARFVAVVTASQNRFGLRAEKTLIMPGMVRYEIDLAKLSERNLEWDAGKKVLTVTMPPIEISNPEIQLSELREYGGGGVLAALTDAERRLDAANRQRGQQELLRQARQPLTMRLARDAARRAVERSFALPLKAAGVDAEVVARFRDEAKPDPSQMDRSRRPEEVLRESAQQR